MRKRAGAAKRTSPKTVDEYIEALSPKEKAVLGKLRQTIKKTAPEAEEIISYGMPGYNYFGMLVFFAAFKNHCSFFGGNGTLTKEMKEELKDFKTSKGTIQFTLEKPLPVALVKKIVKIRMKQNEEKDSLKKT
ncbi:DUF1801 domain-containing protein [soil metagenome]